MDNRVWPTVRTIAGCAMLAALLATRFRRVEGASMRPTLDDGDTVVVLPRWIGFDVGDIVALRDPRDPRRESVKRVVAVAGRWSDLGGVPAEVPRGHIAVEGDDPLASTDSRHYGAVPLDLVIGRTVPVRWRPTAARATSRPPRARANDQRAPS